MNISFFAGFGFGIVVAATIAIVIAVLYMEGHNKNVR